MFCCWKCGQEIRWGRPRCSCPEYVPPPQPEPEPSLFEVHLSSGTSMSGGLKEKYTVRARTVEAAVAHGREKWNTPEGDMEDDVSAHRIPETEDAL